MALAAGREMLAIPGPSVVPDRVLAAMHRPSPNIYEGELLELTDRIFADLAEVAQTEHHVAMYIGNGHAAWEAALVNVLDAGDCALVLSTGTFAANWGQMAADLGVGVDEGGALALDRHLLPPTGGAPPYKIHNSA